jgi:hypothetical protein
MTWNVVVTDEFRAWWETLTDAERDSARPVIDLLEIVGPRIRYPYSSDVRGSQHGQMRELRIQHRGRPYRVLYAFDPMRSAVVLVGGDKTGSKRWYEQMIPVADTLFDRHLRDLLEQTDG